jgi:peptide subunit release factor RF-3
LRHIIQMTSKSVRMNGWPVQLIFIEFQMIDLSIQIMVWPIQMCIQLLGVRHLKKRINHLIEKIQQLNREGSM